MCNKFTSEILFFSAQGVISFNHREPSKVLRAQKLGQAPVLKRSSWTLSSPGQPAQRFTAPNSFDSSTVKEKSSAKSEPDVSPRCAAALKVASYLARK